MIPLSQYVQWTQLFIVTMVPLGGTRKQKSMSPITGRYRAIRVFPWTGRYVPVARGGPAELKN